MGGSSHGGIPGIDPGPCFNQGNVGYLGSNGGQANDSTVEVAKKPNFNESFFCMRDRVPDHPDVISRKLFFGMNPWPSNPPGFAVGLFHPIFRPASSHVASAPLPRPRAADPPHLDAAETTES